MYSIQSHEESERLKAIFLMATDGIITINEKGIIDAVNPAANRLFGYEEDELIGENVSILMPPPYRENHDAYMANYHRTRVPKIIGIGREVKGKRKDGHIFPIRLAISEIQMEDRVIYTGIVHDITTEKEALAEIERLNEELEARVNQRTEELATVINKLLLTNQQLATEVREKQKIASALREQQDDLEQLLANEKKLNELKSRFVSLASHEFRTPLSTILSSAALAARYQLPEQQDKRTRHLNRIKQAVSHLTSILNDFLSLSRLQEGKIECQPEKFDLVELITEVTEEMSAQTSNGQQIVISHPMPSLEMFNDLRITKNILLNLLSNAIKYSPPGKRVELSLKQQGEEIVIAVKDEGIGIPEEDQEHLFNRFFRASNASTIQGTGLGLNIVRRYVEMLGGTIDFTSTLGKGSTFWITIPQKLEQQ